MKKYLIYFSTLCLLVFTGCYEDEIIDSKPGVSLDPVTNLQSNVSGNIVDLTWNLPASYPEPIIQPISVQIVVLVDGSREGGAIVLEGAPKSYTYENYDPKKEYRFTIKIFATIETTEPHVSDMLYSPGSTIEL